MGPGFCDGKIWQNVDWMSSKESTLYIELSTFCTKIHFHFTSYSDNYILMSAKGNIYKTVTCHLNKKR